MQLPINHTILFTTYLTMFLNYNFNLIFCIKLHEIFNRATDKKETLRIKQIFLFLFPLYLIYKKKHIWIKDMQHFVWILSISTSHTVRFYTAILEASI